MARYKRDSTANERRGVGRPTFGCKPAVELPASLSALLGCPRLLSLAASDERLKRDDLLGR